MWCLMFSMDSYIWAFLVYKWFLNVYVIKWHNLLLLLVDLRIFHSRTFVLVKY